MKNPGKIAIWAVIGIAVLVIGFMAFSPAEGTVENVDARRLADLVASGVRVIDVRTEGEYAAGHIAGAELVPIDRFAQAAATWDRTVPLAVYCATGQRSTTAVNHLSGQGFEKVYHFNAGLVAWSGTLERGATAAAPAPEPTASALPVVYEFFTDT